MSVVKYLLNYLKKHKLSLFLIIINIVLIVIATIIPSKLIEYIFDDVINKKMTDKIFMFSIIYFCVYFLISLLNFLKGILLINFSQGFTTYLRISLLNNLHNIPYEELSKENTGVYESYFNNDIEQINTLVTSGVISMVIDIFKIIGIIIMIFTFNLTFGYISLAIIPLIALISYIFKKLMFKAQLKNSYYESKVNDYILQTLNNIKTIKAFRKYNIFEDEYKLLLNKHYNTTKNSNFYDSIFSPLMQLIKIILIILIFIICSKNNYELGISVGVLTALIDLLTNLLQPIENLGTELQTIQKSLASIKRIDLYLEKCNCKYLKKELNNLDNIKIIFDHVYYSYDNINYVIKDFNLIINKNDKIVFKGKSGSGKSTLFKLAYGLIKPSKGRVLINGVDAYLINDESKNKLYQIFFQDYFFGNNTFYEELTLNNKNIPLDKVKEVIKIIGLDKRITNYNDTINPDLFSSGEKALLNLARILIYNPKIIFLDELNAKIDQVTFNKIKKILNDFCVNKTVISINHYGNIINNEKTINIEEMV